MFEGFRGASWPAKFVTIFIVGTFLGLGLCGVGASLGETLSHVADGFFEVGAFSFWASVLGLIVALIVLFFSRSQDRDRR